MKKTKKRMRKRTEEVKLEGGRLQAAVAGKGEVREGKHQQEEEEEHRRSSRGGGKHQKVEKVISGMMMMRRKRM